MPKRIFLFITTFLTATSVSTGYGSTDALKGNVNVATFLDWFNNVEKYVHVKGLIVLDLIPAFFLIIQTVLFFKGSKKVKGTFALLALIANLFGVFFVIQNANPIASQISSWTPDNVPANWITLKDNWINYIGLHGLLSIVGWLFFVITFFVSENKNSEIKQLPRFLNFFKNALIFFLTFLLGMGAASLYESFFFPYSYDISGTTFIELHRPVDLMMRKVGPVMFAFIVTLHLLLAALFFVEKSKNKGWLIVVSVVLLLCDTLIALQYNRPLNDLFLTWTPTTIPANWSNLRDEWLSYHAYRNIFKFLGVASIFLTYFVHSNKATKE
jgi:hypothetical protein